MNNTKTDICDEGDRQLFASDSAQAHLIADLLERSLLKRLSQSEKFWSIGKFSRQYYDREAFIVRAGIEVFGGYRISVIPIAEIGIGVVTHINTAFFSQDTVHDFFDLSLPNDERNRRVALFERYTRRQGKQKGLLCYRLPRSISECYFVKYLEGRICAETSPPSIRGKNYDSLYAYYQETAPDANIRPDDSVAIVKFSGLNDPAPVPAKLLTLRLMNEAVPQTLKQVDKLKPEERVEAINNFWQNLGTGFLGQHLRSELWQPPDNKVHSLTLPTLHFGQDKTLPPPVKRSTQAYNQHFFNRLSTFKEVGAYYVPSVLEQKIFLVYPELLEQEPLKKFAQNVQSWLAQATHKHIDLETLPYKDLNVVIDKLNAKSEGFAIVIMDRNIPDAYYLLSAQLKSMRLKRVTENELLQAYRAGGGRWQSFVDLTLLQVLERLDCLPWGIAPNDLHYAAYLAIDVGEKRKHIALSLMAHSSHISFWLGSDVFIKPKTDKEEIDLKTLQDKIIEVAMRLPSQLCPLPSLLILRDGRQVGEEGAAIEAATKLLISKSIFTPDIQVDVIDLAKSSLRELRFWDRRGKRDWDRTLEGTALQLDPETVFIATTGHATLTQGTAIPFVLSRAQGEPDMLAVAQDMFALAQFNWGNPRVAQRLPFLISLTDKRLQAKMVEETQGRA